MHLYPTHACCRHALSDCLAIQERHNEEDPGRIPHLAKLLYKEEAELAALVFHSSMVECPISQLVRPMYLSVLL